MTTEYSALSQGNLDECLAIAIKQIADDNNRAATDHHLIEMLLESGANPDSLMPANLMVGSGKSDMPISIYALIHKLHDTKTIEFLLRHGANPNIHYQFTSFNLTMFDPMSLVVSAASKYKIADDTLKYVVKMLVEHGYDARIHSKHNINILHTFFTMNTQHRAANRDIGIWEVMEAISPEDRQSMFLAKDVDGFNPVDYLFANHQKSSEIHHNLRNIRDGYFEGNVLYPLKRLIALGLNIDEHPLKTIKGELTTIHDHIRSAFDEMYLRDIAAAAGLSSFSSGNNKPATSKVRL